MLNTVLNPHTHQGIQPQVNQRQLAGQILNVIAHGLRHNQPHALLHRLPTGRIPLQRLRRHIIAQRLRHLLALHHGGGAQHRLHIPTQGRSKPLGNKHHRISQHLVNRNGQPAQIPGSQHRQLTRRWQRGLLLHRDQRSARRELHDDRLHEGDRGRNRVRKRMERKRAIREGHLLPQQGTGATAGGRPGRSPIALLLPRHGGSINNGPGPIKGGEINGGAGNIQLGQQVRNGVSVRHFPLERVKKLGVRLAHAEGGVHHAHDRHRVRGDLHQRGVAGGESLFDSVLEPHGLAGTPHPIVGVVHGLTGLVHPAPIHGAKQGQPHRVGLNPGNGGSKLPQERLNRAGVAGTLHIEKPGEFLLRLQLGHQIKNRLPGTTNGGHARTCVNGGFNAGKVGVFGNEIVELLHRKLHHRHGTQLILGQGLLPLPHEPGPVASNKHGVLGTEATGGVGGGNLTHGHAHHGRRGGAQGGEIVGEGDLDGGNGHLGGFRVVRLFVIKDDVPDRPAGFKIDNAVKFGEPIPEEGGVGEQVLDHFAVLRPETGIHKHRAGGGRRVGKGHALDDLPVGHIAEPFGGLRHRVGQDDRPGTGVVAAGDGAGQCRQVGVVKRGDEIGEGGGQVGAPGWQQAGYWQGNLCAGQGGLGGGGLRLGAIVGGVEVAEHHVGVGAAEAEAAHAGEFRAGVFGPFAGVGHYLQVFGVEVDIAVGFREIQGGRQHVVLHGQHHLDEAGRARGGFGVAEIGFRGAKQGGGGRGAVGAQNRAQGGGLDGVAQNGAGSVGFYVVDLGWVQAGVGVGALQHIHLGLRVGGGETVRMPVRIDGGSLDDGQDRIAVGKRVGNPFQHEHAGAVGTDKTVSIVGKRVNLAGGAKHAELTKGGRNPRGGQNIHAAGKRHIGIMFA